MIMATFETNIGMTEINYIQMEIDYLKIYNSDKQTYSI